MITQPGLIRDVPLTQTMPPALEYDERMPALGGALSDLLQEQVALALGSVGIYYQIYQLPEKVLDILAADLHADWYDYDGSLEEKRRLIAKNVEIHRKMGTVSMLRTVIESIHGDSSIEEWFQYGGDPYFFRVAINITDSMEQIDQRRIVDAIRTYKPVRAWLEDGAIAYRWVDVMLLSMRTGYIIYTNRKSGTYPYNMFVGATPDEEEIIITTPVTGGAAAGHKTGDMEAKAGYFPHVVTAGAAVAAEIIVTAEEAGAAIEGRKTGAPESKAGQYPYISLAPGQAAGEMELAAALAGTNYETPKSGTIPRNPYVPAPDDEKGLSLEADARGVPYSTKKCGDTIF